MKKLGFGCMRLPLTDPQHQDSVDLTKMKQMVDLFISKGFTYFDTAWMYHDFKSEIFVRRALVERYQRDAFVLADKLPLSLMKEGADADELFDKQKEKCGVDYFDVYLLHNINRANYEKATGNGWFETVKRRKANGEIKRLGFSFHSDAELLDKALREHPEIEIVQLQLNYLDWNSDRIQSGKCYQVAREHGRDIVVMEPVKGGMLAHLPREAGQILQAAAPGKSAASWAVRFAAGLPGVIVVLSGMSDQEQMEDNLSYMEDFQPLSDYEHEALKKVVSIIDKAVAIPCTACRYCVEGCPRKIAIPEFFNLFNRRAQQQKQAWYSEGAYYNDYTREHSKASDCIACGACEKACPQHLPIIEDLKRVAEVFEKE
ncbi:MAG: aldo/keto reductase [Anaerovoracaceae bacterium]|jgi:predicted aldo/keto reductase-like oxidoreductase